jgi:hypothetical protein
MLGEQIVAFPDTPDSSCEDVDFTESKFLGHPKAAVSGEFQSVLEDGFLDRLGNPIGMRVSRPGKPIKKPLGAVDLEVPADFVELLSGVTHDFAGFRNVVEILGKFEETEFATSDFVFSGHVWFWVGVFVVKTTYQVHVAAVSFKTAPLSGEY